MHKFKLKTQVVRRSEEKHKSIRGKSENRNRKLHVDVVFGQK